MDSDSIILIQVNSGDFSTLQGDTYYNFTNQIQRVILDPAVDYEVCLFDILFQNDQDITNTATYPLRGYFVNTDLVGRNIVGGNTNNSIFQIPWTKLVTESVPSGTFGANTGIF